MIAVTGVTAPSDGGTSAVATFDWRWKARYGTRLTPGVIDADSGTGQARLQRYDDGWRIAQIALNAARAPGQ